MFDLNINLRSVDIMHICYVIWIFKSPNNFQQMGGAENQLLKIINKLKTRDDISITIISKKTPDDESVESF